MPSPRSEAILRRIKSLLPKPEPRIAAPPRPREVGDIEDDLRQALDTVGQANYAHATAHLFAPGGKYNRVTQRKYALT